MKAHIKKSLIIKIVLLMWMTVFIWMNGSVQSLWIDELSSIGYIRSGISLKDMMYTYLFCDTNMPLYSIILYYVYRIVPYGEKFLLIPSILFCIMGIVVMSNLMKRISGERVSLIVLCLGCASNTIIWQGAWEARCYALTFMLSVIAFLYYVETVKNANKKALIGFSIAAFFFMTTHWFACVLLAVYGAIDLILIFYKKKSWQAVLTYIPGLMFFVPWFIISFMSKQEEYNNFWGMIPEWKNMVWTILFWLSGRHVLWYVCLITGMIVCIKWVVSLIQKKEIAFENIIAVVCVVSIGWVIGIIYIYSRYVNPEGSLYIDRYFIVIAPHIILLTAYGMDSVISLCNDISKSSYIKKDYLKRILPCLGNIAIGVIISICWIQCYREGYIAIRKPFQQFREASEYLIEDGKIWDKDTLFVASNKYCGLDGFIEYYFIKRGYEEPVNIIDGKVNSLAESKFYPNYSQYSEAELLEYDTIIDFRIHMSFDEEFVAFLEKNYTNVQIIEGLGIGIWERKTE